MVIKDERRESGCERSEVKSIFCYFCHIWQYEKWRAFGKINMYITCEISIEIVIILMKCDK